MKHTQILKLKKKRKHIAKIINFLTNLMMIILLLEIHHQVTNYINNNSTMVNFV